MLEIPQFQTGDRQSEGGGFRPGGGSFGEETASAWTGGAEGLESGERPADPAPEIREICPGRKAPEAGPGPEIFPFIDRRSPGISRPVSSHGEHFAAKIIAISVICGYGVVVVESPKR